MARYNNNDQRNLEELLEEKWFDRFKARGAEALGSAKGLGQQLKGGLQQAVGSGLSKAGDWLESDKISRKGDKYIQQGQKSEQEGSVSGHNSKVQYLQKNIDKRIDSFVADIKNDIKKLGLDIGNIEIVSGINAALGQLKKSVSGATPPPLPQQSGTTPPPLPTQKLPKKAISRKKKPRPITNPLKGKVKKDPQAMYAAPEQEEDLDKMFWED